jgi:hypothetical protein
MFLARILAFNATNHIDAILERDHREVCSLGQHRGSVPPLRGEWDHSSSSVLGGQTLSQVGAQVKKLCGVKPAFFGLAASDEQGPSVVHFDEAGLVHEAGLAKLRQVVHDVAREVLDQVL